MAPFSTGGLLVGPNNGGINHVSRCIPHPPAHSALHGDVALDSRHLLARVIALVLGAVGVLDALGVHDTEAGPFFPTIASPGCANRFFLRPAPEWNTSPGRVARSIAGNTCSRCANPGSPQAASATGTRFSGDRGRKRRTSPRCGAWSGGGPTPNREVRVSYCKDRRQALRGCVTMG